MNLSRISSAILMTASFSIAMAIQIKGVVQDDRGRGIPGATVKLIEANISTTTGPTGSFSLSNRATSINPEFKNHAGSKAPVEFYKNGITLTLSENTSVSIAMNKVGGSQFFFKQQAFSPGTHSIQ